LSAQLPVVAQPFPVAGVVHMFYTWGSALSSGAAQLFQYSGWSSATTNCVTATSTYSAAVQVGGSTTADWITEMLTLTIA
jgi:hypothetical protein